MSMLDLFNLAPAKLTMVKVRFDQQARWEIPLALFAVRDLGALRPLLTQHINPYGRFEPDLNTRLELEV
jgi:hypothetical protein